MSPNWIVVEFTAVVVPATVKLPNTLKLPFAVKFTPLAVNAVLNDDVYEFNSDTEVFKLAVVKFMFVIETPCESFVVFAVDAEAIKLPLTTPISVNLVSADAVKLFNAFVDVLDDVYEFNAATEISTLDDLDSKLFNLPSFVSFVDFSVDAELIN